MGPSIAACVIGLDANLVMRDGDLLGHLLDTHGAIEQMPAEDATFDMVSCRDMLGHGRGAHGRVRFRAGHWTAVGP